MNVDLLPELGGVEHRFDDLGGDVTIHVADAGPADGAPVMLVHGFPQNWWGVTVVGHSLGGGVAMQFAYQHPDYCQRLILISSGGLGPDLGRTLRILSAPGAEFVLPVIAPRPVLTLGNKLRSWFASAGIQSPRGGELWNAYSSLSDRQTQQAFLRTLRAVVDYRGQAVSALNRLDELPPDLPTMAIWGDKTGSSPSSMVTRRMPPGRGFDLRCSPVWGTSPTWSAQPGGPHRGLHRRGRSQVDPRQTAANAEDSPNSR